MHYMVIRKARHSEMSVIMALFEQAKAYMHSQGNTRQWGDDYPPCSLIEQEVAAGHFYCVERDDTVVGVFSFLFGEDVEPTYAVIYDGRWMYDEPYGVVHRLASNGTVKGIADYCFEWCKQRCQYLRVDTHRDNKTMQQAALRNGFVRSGIIVLSRNGDKRIAYEWHKE